MRGRLVFYTRQMSLQQFRACVPLVEPYQVNMLAITECLVMNQPIRPDVDLLPIGPKWFRDNQDYARHYFMYHLN